MPSYHSVAKGAPAASSAAAAASGAADVCLRCGGPIAAGAPVIRSARLPGCPRAELLVWHTACRTDADPDSLDNASSLTPAQAAARAAARAGESLAAAA